MPVAHQPVGQLCLVAGGGLCQCAGHQLLAHAYAHAAGDELVENEPLGPTEACPSLQHKSLFGRFICFVDVSQIVDPLRQRPVVRSGILRQDEGNCLSQIADNGIAFLEQPQGNACGLSAPLAQAGRGYRALGSAARKQRDGPELVLLICYFKVVCQCFGFNGGFGALVDGVEEGCKLFHAASSASSERSRLSPSNWVGTTWAFQPFSFR